MQVKLLVFHVPICTTFLCIPSRLSCFSEVAPTTLVCCIHVIQQNIQALTQSERNRHFARYVCTQKELKQIMRTSGGIEAWRFSSEQKLVVRSEADVRSDEPCPSATCSRRRSPFSSHNARLRSHAGS
jgi:hypothetical protein